MKFLANVFAALASAFLPKKPDAPAPSPEPAPAPEPKAGGIAALFALVKKILDGRKTYLAAAGLIGVGITRISAGDFIGGAQSIVEGIIVITGRKALANAVSPKLEPAQSATIAAELDHGPDLGKAVEDLHADVKKIGGYLSDLSAEAVQRQEMIRQIMTDGHALQPQEPAAVAEQLLRSTIPG